MRGTVCLRYCTNKPPVAVWEIYGKEKGDKITNFTIIVSFVSKIDTAGSGFYGNIEHEKLSFSRLKYYDDKLPFPKKSESQNLEA